MSSINSDATVAERHAPRNRRFALRKLQRVFVAAATGLALTSCVAIDLPNDFLEVDRGLGELKAVSSDGALFWTRKFKDPHRGNLEFWSNALESDFADNRGYVMLEQGETTLAGGRQRYESVWETRTRGVSYRYLVTLEVIQGWFGNKIVVSEFVAPSATFDGYVDEVRAAVASMKS